MFYIIKKIMTKIIPAVKMNWKPHKPLIKFSNDKLEDKLVLPTQQEINTELDNVSAPSTCVALSDKELHHL